MNTGLIKIKDLEARLVGVPANEKGDFVSMLPSISGTITKVYDPTSGGTGNQSWKYQNLEIQDETGKIKVSLSKCRTISTLGVGKPIYFESTGSKFGMIGVSYVKSKFHDKKTGQARDDIGLKVTAKCRIISDAIVDDSHIQNEPADVVQNSPEEEVVPVNATIKSTWKNLPTAVQTLEIKQNPPQASTTPNLVDQMRRYEVLYAKCIRHALDAIEIGAGVDLDFSTDNVKDIASCFFIQSIKDGLLSQVAIGDFKNPELQEEPF